MKLVTCKPIDHIGLTKGVSCGLACVAFVLRKNNKTTGELIDHTVNKEYHTIPELALFLQNEHIQTTLYSYSYYYFDPIWFSLPEDALKNVYKTKSEDESLSPKVREYYHNLLAYTLSGGKTDFKLIGRQNLSKFLAAGKSILLNVDSGTFFATQSYKGGGHFCVLEDIDRKKGTATVMSPGKDDLQVIQIDVDTLICSYYRGGGWALVGNHD